MPYQDLQICMDRKNTIAEDRKACNRFERNDTDIKVSKFRPRAEGRLLTQQHGKG